MDELSKDQSFSQSLQAAAAATARTACGDDDEIGAERLEKMNRLKRELMSGAYKWDIPGLSKRIIDEHSTD
jgi:anti-sigma28 factor (negative regulator of flagellin synthesis)